MEEKKTCFKCHKELPLDMFYRHKGMADGHLNKCKECTKNDTRERYMVNSENPEYMIKERERCRAKDRIRRQKGLNKCYPNKGKGSGLFIRRRIRIPSGSEIHHWNYNLLYDVFIINMRWHRRIHKKIVFDDNSRCFLYEGELLDTKEKHENAIRSILGLSNEQKIDKLIIERTTN